MSNPACIDSFGRPTFGDERRLGEFGADFREHVLPGADRVWLAGSCGDDAVARFDEECSSGVLPAVSERWLVMPTVESEIERSKQCRCGTVPRSWKA